MSTVRRVTIASRLFRPEHGAAAYRLGVLADELKIQGYDVTVLTTRPPAPLSSSAADDGGVTVRRWPVLRDKGGNVRGYIQYLSFDIPLFFRLLFGRMDVVVVEPGAFEIMVGPNSVDLKTTTLEVTS